MPQKDKIFIPALRKSLRTTLWLLKIIVPISLLVRLLDYFGMLAYLAEFLNPIFIHLGLPGSTAIVFITSIFLPLYAPIAIIISLPVTLRELTILALMCQIAHNLPVESAIQAKTGTSFRAMVTLRILMSIAVGALLNLILPQNMGMPLFTQIEADSVLTLDALLTAWLISSLKMALLIFVIIASLNLLYLILEKYLLIEKISRAIGPLLKFFGLSQSTAFLWLIGYIVGLAYGGALMIEQMSEGKVSRNDVKLLNYHLAMSHSIIEDNFIFVALGVSIGWILAVRLTIAFIVVWIRRGYQALFQERRKLSAS